MSSTTSYYEAYLEQLRTQRNSAVSHPLKPSIALTGKPAYNLFTQDVIPDPVSADSRRTLRPMLPFDASQGLSLVLLCSLRTGAGQWSQVWTASMLGLNAHQTNPVVIKLFHEGLFPIPDLLDFRSYQRWCASTQSANEAWAFAKLQHLQGSLLPHSYGFYWFHLPCGQTVCGHVMEYIQGHPLERDYRSMIDGSFSSHEKVHQRQRMLERLVDAAQTLQLNVFGLATATYSVRTWGTSLVRGLWSCLREVEDGEVVYAWLEEQIQADELWTAPFRRKHTLKNLRSGAKVQEMDYRRRSEQLRIEGAL